MKDTPPNLNKTYACYALMSIALGVNFLLVTPPFMPLSIDKTWIGVIDIFSGLQLLLALLLKREQAVPPAMALVVMIFFFWATALTVEFVRLHQTSMQLPIVYIGHVVVGYRLLTFPSPPPASTPANGVDDK